MMHQTFESPVSVKQAWTPATWANLKRGTLKHPPLYNQKDLLPQISKNSPNRMENEKTNRKSQTAVLRGSQAPKKTSFARRNIYAAKQFDAMGGRSKGHKKTNLGATRTQEIEPTFEKESLTIVQLWSVSPPLPPTRPTPPT